MDIPIVMVHGIGQYHKSADFYYKTWKKHSWTGFKPIFYNACWQPYGFNLKGSYADSTVGFTDLSNMNSSLLDKIPFMQKMAYYANSKLAALNLYGGTLPWYKRLLVSTTDKYAFKFLGTEVLDFIGDVFTYLQWEEYTLENRNPIKSVVRFIIEEAMGDFPYQPIHIVCHSLGTKIVWDVLNDMKNTLPSGSIGLLITLASPLQPMSIFNFVRAEDNINYVKPRSVDHWLNVYDVRDLIGAPIGSAAFRRRSGEYETYAEVMAKESLWPCANVCTDIGSFPWSAHTQAWTNKKPKLLFDKYIQKYLKSDS